MARLPILEPEPPAEDAGQPEYASKSVLSLWLSLMLVLLSFFIAWLAAAQPKPVVARTPTINSADTQAAAGPRSNQDIIAEDVARSEAVQLIATLSSAIAGPIASDSEPSQPALALSATVTLPVAAWFEPLAETVRADRLAVVERIAEAGSDLPEGFQLLFNATLMLGTDGTSTSVATGDDMLAAERAAAFAATVVSRGLPPEAIAVGIAPGRSGEMAITVRAYPIGHRVDKSSARAATPPAIGPSPAAER